MNFSIPKLFGFEAKPNEVPLNIDAGPPLNFHLSAEGPEPTVTDVEISERFSKRKFFALIIDNVLSPEECEEVIRVTEERGYGQAMVNVGGGRQKLMDDYRKSLRYMSDDKEFAQQLFLRVEKFIPQQWLGHKVVGLNERLRFLKYSPGDYFDKHCDGCYTRPDYSERSYITLQLYLNDREGGNGGETTFFDVIKDGKVSDVKVCPRPGRVLIFEHRIVHEGSLVVDGFKYAMRTDIMYTNNENSD
jgi:predicted 2-oxoglutarate/Fe(II)-dependent dioxygenase YbiX